MGVMFGYVLLPMMLVQNLGFDHLSLPVQYSELKPSEIHLQGVNAIAALKPANKESLSSNLPSRILYNDDTKLQKQIEAAQTKEEPDLKESHTEPNAEEVKETAGTSESYVEKADGKKGLGAIPKQETKILRSGHSGFVIKEHFNDAEQRILEDRLILSKQSIPTATSPNIMLTETLPDHQRKKILVTGGAGFVGSHLVDKLMMEGHEVIVVDNFFTGQKKNVAHWLQHPNFSLVVHDVTEPLQLEVDQIYHLACPASPPHYQYNPVKTIKTSTMGTLNMLGLAKRVRARMLLTSTSEIYGDPLVHPQHESYWGNVNTIGPRSCYDEGKRVAETMMYSYRNQNQVEVRVARIFNTFGPRMHPNDGRVVSNFIIQALQNKNMTIYGEGDQTRSFQYVSDLVEGLYALMNGDYDLPVNLGNPDEYTVKSFAEYIKQMTTSKSEIMFLPKNQDDPSQRRPNITTAKEHLNWEPKVTVEEGLRSTIAYFSRLLQEAGEIIPTGPGAAKPEA